MALKSGSGLFNVQAFGRQGEDASAGRGVSLRLRVWLRLRVYGVRRRMQQRRLRLWRSLRQRLRMRSPLLGRRSV